MGEIGKEKIVNVPNSVTLFRLLLVVPLGYFLVNYDRLIASVLFGVIISLDLADGRLARRLGQVTKFGKTFDYLSDITLGGTVFVISAVLGRLNIWTLALCAVVFLAYGVLVVVGMTSKGHLVTGIKEFSAIWTFVFVFLMLLNLSYAWVDYAYYVFIVGLYAYTIYYFFEIRKVLKK